jgi:hypothetical protein
VAVRVAEETVVVVAGGAVVVVLLAGGLLEFVVPWLDVVEALVVGGGAVLEGVVDAVEVVEFELEPVFGGVLASEPSDNLAGVELKLSTAASPAIVPTITSGARFIVTLIR